MSSQPSTAVQLMADQEGVTVEQYLQRRALDNAKEAFAKQLKCDGKKSLEKSLKTLQKRLQEHLDKMAKDPTSPSAKNHWPEEIKKFETQIEAVKSVLSP